MAEIYLAGGCFWGLEKYLGSIKGVRHTEVGYANGGSMDTTYEDVCRGSGHAETVKVVYDPDVLPLDFLLSLFYEAIDPASVNRQGNDRGIQSGRNLLHGRFRPARRRKSLADCRRARQEPVERSSPAARPICRRKTIIRSISINPEVTAISSRSFKRRLPP